MTTWHDFVKEQSHAPDWPYPVRFDEEQETGAGCNHRVEVCQIEVYMPNPRKGKPPIILHPEECWSCGCCANDCPRPGAIRVQLAPSGAGVLEEQGDGRDPSALGPSLLPREQPLGMS